MTSKSCRAASSSRHPNSQSGSQYDEDYFIRGKQTGKSLYENYRWLPELTVPMSQAIVDYCGIVKGERILDFGCARGYLVKALRGLGHDAYGIDISEWAIRNADEETKPFLNWDNNSPPFLPREFDWIIAKDVLEHVEYVSHVINYLMEVAGKGMFVVVPLSWFDGGCYIIDEYEKDTTHIQRHPLFVWAELFIRPGWQVEASYRVKGVKDNYAQYKRGNGFITARRINEDEG